MKKTTIKTFGNAYQTVTLSDEPRIHRCWLGDELVSYTEHLLWITVRKTHVGIVNEFVVEKYVDVDGEQARKDALHVAEIEMNCIMTYGI